MLWCIFLDSSKQHENFGRLNNLNLIQAILIEHSSGIGEGSGPLQNFISTRSGTCWQLHVSGVCDHPIHEEATWPSQLLYKIPID